jgi:protein MpaA
LDTFQFAQTTTGLPVFAHNFGRQGPRLLIIGGVHGNEPEGVIAALGLIQRYNQSFTLGAQVTICPMFNLDGVLARTRKNARGVDLNRNLPTKDWTKDVAEEKYFPGTSANSEPENQALVSWIEQYKPKLIISLHSWNPLLNVNGACQPEAQILNRLTGYEIKEDIGYPTPGCLGTYCGLERDIPTLTYEIERGLGSDQILTTHVKALNEALKISAERF